MTRPPAPGLGDRWLAGEAVDGVAFAPQHSVELARGTRAGERATVLLLIGIGAEPIYRVRTATGDELHVRQSALREAGGAGV